MLRSNRSLADRKGQVAIFIALIFQVLFLFFAMVINVGLLVHHKVNLQNSADLAAYYGAMKQAELLNAIGHINYQIRQSYKLLTWRYRVLGTAGVFPQGAGVNPEGGSPVVKNDASLGRQGASILGGEDYEGINKSNPQIEDYYGRPSFCIAFRPFKEIPENENTCRSPLGQTIAALRRPPIIAPFVGAAQTALRVTDLANQSQQLRCEYAGPYNYVALARFVVAYNIDQGDRKVLVYKLANGMSDSTDDFVDIEGERAKVGIKKTLLNNLSAANREAIKDKPDDRTDTNIHIYNSLAHDRCKMQLSGGARPPKWLSDVWIFPRCSYKMCTYQQGGGSTFAPANIDQYPDAPGMAARSSIPTELLGSIDYLKGYVAPGADSNPYKPALGFEKNPWCMAYIGVSVKSKPQIPFSLGDVEIKAVSFAKPFGGRIGPWFGKNWRAGDPESTGAGTTERTDPLLPIRCANGNFENCAVQGQDAVTTLNYSRFPGDKFGMASRRVHAQYGKSLFDLGNPSVNLWEGIELPTWRRPSEEWDILSTDNDEPGKKMRKLEISAVVPDLFDLTYYSIDPDFYNNYYKDKIESYVNKHPISTSQSSGSYKVRMDIGARGYTDRTRFNIKDQLKTTAELGAISSGNSNYGLDLQSKLLYMIYGTEKDSFAKVLTSWVPQKDLTDYSLDTNRFGHCTDPIVDDVDAVPGGCKRGGGRTGYSVKLVSSDFLLATHKLGGEGSSSEQILNPPPADFFK